MSRVSQPHRDALASEWNVYADALQEANDPRGELIALNGAVASGMSPADRDAYVAKHKAALLGAAAEHFDSYRITWHWSLIDGVEVRANDTATAARLVEAILSSPLATELRSLTLCGVATPQTHVDLTAAMATAAAMVPASCKSLAFVDERASKTTMMVSRDYDPPDNLVKFGSLEPFWAKAEELRIECADSAQLELGKIDGPALRSFTLRSLRLASAYGDPSLLPGLLAEGTLPQLRSLELRLPEEFGANIANDQDSYNPSYFGDEDYEDRMDEAEDGENYEGINWAQLRPLLDKLRSCPLERLALTSFDSAASLLEVLGEAGLPPSVVELDFSDSSINSADWFLTNKPLLANLRKLVLERTPLSEEDLARLRAGLGIEVVHSQGSGATFRYVVGSE